MPTSATVYRRAARRVRRGWVQKRWSQGRRVCMLEAVRIELGLKSRELPSDLIDEIHAFLLRRTPDYSTMAGTTLQTRITGWNDTPGRSKWQVARILDGLALQAKRIEDDALRAENDRLSKENCRLRAEVDELRAALTANVDAELEQLTAVAMPV